MPRRWILPPRCHTHTQNARTLLLVGRCRSVHQMVGTALPQVSSTENISPNHCWPTVSMHLPNSPGISVSVDYFGPLPITTRGNSYILLFTDRFSRGADIFAVTATEFTAERVANILVNRFSYPPLGMPINSSIRQRIPVLRTACNNRLQTFGYTQTHDKRPPSERKRRRRTCKPHHGTNASHYLQRMPKRLECTPSPRRICL